MKIDLYTKVCFTVISLSLCAIAFKDTSIIKPSWASSDVVHKIAICQIDGSDCVETEEFGRKNALVVFDYANWMKKLFVAIFLVLFSSSAFSETYSCINEDETLEYKIPTMTLKRFDKIFIWKEALVDYEILREVDDILVLARFNGAKDHFSLYLISINKKNLNSRLYALDNKYYDKITGIAGIVDRKCEVSD